MLLPRGGRFLSYPFNLTTNVHLAVRGTLLGPVVPDLARWPILPHFPSYELSRSGHWTRFAPLVGVYNATNVSITGGGTGIIDGRGPWWWGSVPKGKALSSERPRLVEPEWVRGLLVRGITLTQSPYWTLHPIYCDDVTVVDVTITGHAAAVEGGAGPAMMPYNTDGIDPDSCTNVLIENYSYCGGDDAVAVKSGWNWVGRGSHSSFRRTPAVSRRASPRSAVPTPAWSRPSPILHILWCVQTQPRSAPLTHVPVSSSSLCRPQAGIAFGKPSKNIVVRNATSGCRGGFTIGSEMSGGVENVTFIDCRSTGQLGMRISSELGRGGSVALGPASHRPCCCDVSLRSHLWMERVRFS